MTTIGEYLISAIQKTGTRHVFGIQGDYVLNFYSQLCKSPLNVINTCTEQGAGFAADAYARLTGFGVACVTYGVGGLNLINSTAQAFAERSPVLIVSGAPGISERQRDPLLHHKVQTFETQFNIFKEITVAQAILNDPLSAANSIDRVICEVMSEKRPGYIELPRDMVDTQIKRPQAPLSEYSFKDQATCDEACQEALAMISAAKHPVFLAGVEVHRFGLQKTFLKLLERSKFPFATGILGKSVITETHPQFLGVYVGAMSVERVRTAVEESDCIIALGPFLTDLATGMFTHHIDTAKLIVVSPNSVSVKHHTYPDLDMKYFLETLISRLPQIDHPAPSFPPYRPDPFVPQPKQQVTVERLMQAVNHFIDDNSCVIAEPGDALFGALDIHVHNRSEFISPAYYASLGFSIPASIGVKFADPNRRPLIITGDGSFQMMGMELSTAARYGQNPIIIILNNGGYGTFRSLIDGSFNDICPWQYSKIPAVIGSGKGFSVLTESELQDAFSAAAQDTASLIIIDVHLAKNDFSAAMQRLKTNLKKHIK